MLIDTERPELTLNVNEGRLQAHVEELVSPETLEVLWRLNNDDNTSPWRPLKGELALEGMSGRVEVMARDVSGNESLIQSISVSTEADSPSTNSNPNIDANTNCHADPNPNANKYTNTDADSCPQSFFRIA